VVDNTSRSFSRSGPWSVVSDGYGDSSLVGRNSNDCGNELRAVWTASLQPARYRFEIYLNDGTAEVPYTLSTGYDTRTFTMSQQRRGWVSLGDFQMRSFQLTLAPGCGGPYTADAVRLTPVG
jgi:hypothetical protein